MVIIDRINQADSSQLSYLYGQLIGEKTDIQKLLESFQLINGSQDYTLLVAKSSNKFLGSMLGIIRHDVAGEGRPFMVIENVIVTNGFRRKKIVSMLMKHLKECARQRDCHCITLAPETETIEVLDSMGRFAMLQGDTRL